MQLLERNDQKKWMIWFQNGKVGFEVNGATKVLEYFSKYDAMAEFERRFLDRTGNKWKNRDYF